MPTEHENPGTISLRLFLSRNARYSRRKATEAILAGAVKVNGVAAREPSVLIDPQKDCVVCGNLRVRMQQFRYVLLNKPKGFTTTREDRFAPKIVYDLLPKEFAHLVPAGRLDQDTEGLLLLTNDGDVIHALTHPRFKVDKTYYAVVDGALESEARQKLERGVFLDGRRTAPSKIQILRKKKEITELRITIHEGRNRQVRRMFAKVRLKVKYLQRISQGPLVLRSLYPGQWRELNKNEIKELQNLIKTP